VTLFFCLLACFECCYMFTCCTVMNVGCCCILHAVHSCEHTVSHGESGAGHIIWHMRLSAWLVHWQQQ
jgi:hypothetical protein